MGHEAVRLIGIEAQTSYACISVLISNRLAAISQYPVTLKMSDIVQAEKLISLSCKLRLRTT